MRLFSTLLTIFVAAIVVMFALTACGETNTTRQAKITDPIAQTTPNQNVNQPTTPTPTPADGAARISIADAQREVESGKAVYVDVRDENSYRTAHIKGALSFPLDKIVARRDELPKDKKLITYCS